MRLSTVPSPANVFKDICEVAPDELDFTQHDDGVDTAEKVYNWEDTLS